MIFESLWPLFFLAAIPIIIILYLLKPKGSDYLISSNLLWDKLVKNEHSKTFFEKFVHNILMYLQILIVALLIIALMAPFINVDGKSGGRKILLIDTSGSMQHVDSNGKSRLEEAVEQACDYVQTVENTKFSVMTVDGNGVELLAVDSTDTSRLVQMLKQLECADSSGSLADAQGMLDTLVKADAENEAGLLVFTDGSGAAEFEALYNVADKELHVVGTSVKNVANDYTVFTQRDDGLYDVMVSMTNYSDENVSLDVGLYDGENLIGLQQMYLAPSESRASLFEDVDWQGEYLSSKLSGMDFAAGGKDSLEADDMSHAVKAKSDLINGLLVSDGNTFIEKAYRAVTGTNIAKSISDGVSDSIKYNVVIYDANQAPQMSKGNRMIFGDARGNATEELNNVVLDMTDCDLTVGLSGFHIGVNKAYCFDLPEGAESFIEYNGKCVGYYLEEAGLREVVVGFDIRESDFPLRAEFPVFLANAMLYLTDTSWLATNVYYAGEEIALQPWAELAPEEIPTQLSKAGLYQIGNEEYQEDYVVRFQTTTESDGRIVAESMLSSGELQLHKVKQTLRNLFIALAIAFLILEWILYVRQMRYKGKFYLVLRGLVFLCVVLALLGLHIRLKSDKTATIFMVDLSNSNEENIEEINEYLSDTIDKMPANNSYGIVTFGKDTYVEQFVSAEKKYGGLLTNPEGTATNFEEAVSKALTLIPEDTNGRLLILTDGKETRGDIKRMAQAITTGQTEVLTLLYEEEDTTDAYIDNVIVPSYLHPGEKYSINVVVESNYSTDAVVSLYQGSNKIAANKIHLNEGSNHYVFRGEVSPDSKSDTTQSIWVQVTAEGDDCEENNSYSAFSVIEAVPKILVVTNGNSGVEAFASVLQAAGCDYNVVSALNAPSNMNAMLEYKSIVLVDTYIDDLPTGFLDNLESYVKDYGCGFICCGGESSYALGGYRGSVLETILPVDMIPKSINEMPSMAMVMIIDHSGSMLSETNGSGATNLDLAITAANVAVDNLLDTDYVGVLTFDDRFDWQVELTKADDKSKIKEKISAIEAGGGTTIKPAVHEAFDAISQSEATVKHVILLTDGVGETTNYADVIREYANSEVTLSTVAVGEGADTKLLEYLALNCGGRYYYSDLGSDIPKIFAQEVFLGNDSYIQNGDFPLSVRSSHELTTGIFKDGWPHIYGYIAATPKAISNQLISSADKDNPILTVWQYGLGRTVAWNSDVTGAWTGAFSGQEDYVQLWKRIVDYSVGNADIGEDSVDVITAGEYTEINYQTEDYDNSTEIVATVIDSEGNSREVMLYATAPGKYKVDIPTEKTGMYHFNIRRMGDGQIQSYITTAATVQFSDEYKFDISTDSYMSFIEQYGRVVKKTDNVWTKHSADAKGKYPLTNWLLGVSVLLFLADVATRRFQYVPKWKVHKKDIADMSKESLMTQETMRPEEEKAEKKSKSKKAASKKKMEPKASEQMLDTSSLLRKKDDRNI